MNYRNIIRALVSIVVGAIHACPAQLLCRACPDHANRIMSNHRIIGESAGENRRSVRLQEYDYSQAGAYFITICMQNRKCLFGDIVDDEMVLNDAGRVVA